MILHGDWIRQKNSICTLNRFFARGLGGRNALAGQSGEKAVLTESAELVFPVERASDVTPDPDDEMILECALAAEADFIVSGDKKHLLELRQFQGIPIVSPADFLRRI